MKTAFLGMAAALLLTLSACSRIKPEETPRLYPSLKKYIGKSVSQYDQIPETRKMELEKIATYVRDRVRAGQPSNLTYICTHNSRRSHLAQIWSQTAAAYYRVPMVTAYSGGIEATAFNPRAVAAISRAGFKIEKTTEADNPIYHVRYAGNACPTTHFSKVYNYAPNPTKDFVAIMTCSNADKKCPFVFGSSLRVAIPYEDPKAFDGTDRESAAYDERCRQISREMLYLMSQVGK